MGQFQLALGTYDGGILTYQVNEDLELHEYFGGVVHKGALRYLNWVDETTLVTGASDESCCLCNCESEEIDTWMVGARGCAGAFSQEWSRTSAGSKSSARRKGGMITTVACDGTVEVHQYTVPKPVFTTSFGQRNEKGKPLTHSSDICRVALNTHFGGLYACVYLDGSVWLWNIEKKLPLAKIHKASRKPEHGYLRAIDAAWASEGDYLVILCKAALKVIQIETGLTKTVSAKSGRQFTSLTIEDEIICAGDNQGTISLYKLLPAVKERQVAEKEDGHDGAEDDNQDSGEDDEGNDDIQESDSGESEGDQEGDAEEPPRKRQRRTASQDDESPPESGKPESSEDANQFTIEEWIEIDVPDKSRVKLMKAFRPDAGLLVNIVFCLKQGQVSMLKVKEDESVSFSQILDCPYTLTALDARSNAL